MGILEADTIKEAEMKEKKVEVTQTNEKIDGHQRLPKKSYHGNACLIITTVLKMVKGKIQTNGPKDELVDDDAPGLLFKGRER